MDVVRLLRSRNRCLEKFLAVSTRFLKHQSSLDLSSLQKLEDARNHAIKAFQLYEKKINEIIPSIPSSSRTPDFKEKIKKLVAEHESMLGQILTTDDEIIERIENEKKRLLLEFNSSKKQTTLVKKFKSVWLNKQGEELDKTL
ncbi:MAG: hypothetical protein AABZ06_04170 [Bdellovibrionota bacterium]